MIMKTPYLISALALALIASSALAQQAPKPEALIKWRQSSFQLIAWNSGRIKAATDGQYDKEQALKAAKVISSVANGGLSSLFASNTEKGIGWHETSVNPQFVGDAYRFSQLAKSLGVESAELVKVIETGELDAVKTQYGKLTRTCKTCHDDYRVSSN